MLRTSLLYLAGRFGSAAVLLAGVAAFTRLVPPAEYGLYALSASAASFLYSGLLYWVRDALLRFLPRHADDEGLLLTQLAAGFCLIAALTVLGAAGLFMAFAGDQSRRVVLYTAILFLTLAACEIGLALLQSRLQPGRYARLSLWRALITSGAGALFAWLGWGATGLVAGAAAGAAVAALPVLRGIVRLVEPRRFDVKLLREAASYGIGFSSVGALVAFNAVSDRYLIGWLIGSEAAGLYAAPYDLTARSLQVLMLAVNLAGTPLVFRAYDAGGLAAATPLLRRQFALLVGIGFPAAIGMAILARFTATLLLGGPFQASGETLMPWIAAATALQGLELFYFSFAFSLSRRPLAQFLVLLPTALLNLALNLVLIPRLGLLGAAMATLATYIASLVGMIVVGRRHLAVPLPLAELAKVAAACAVMAAVLWPFRQWTGLPALAVALGLAAPVYGACVIAMNVAGIRTALVRHAPAMGRRLRGTASIET